MDGVLSVSNLLGAMLLMEVTWQWQNLLVTGNIIRQSIAPSLWKSKDAIRVKQAFNDTIYTISEQGLTPYLVLNWVSGTGMSSSNWM